MCKMISILWFSIIFFGCERATDSNLIDSIQIDKNCITIYPAEEFVNEYLRCNNFFIEYDQKFDLSTLDETVLTIPFIMDVIPMVWVSNKSWFIKAMDEDLYYSLEKIQRVFKFFYPSLSWSGKLIPCHLIKNVPQEQFSDYEQLCDSAILFSGGLDAVYTSMRHCNKRQLLITICGSDIKFTRQHLWNCVQKRCQEYAELYGHCNAFIRSNFAALNHNRLKTITPEINNWWAYTMQAMGYTSLAAPLLVLTGQKKLLIASTRTKDYPFPYGTHPLIDNTICFAGIQVAHDGAEFNRLEKIKEIVSLCQEYKLPVPFLRVCWGRDRNGGNCCRCEKCLRTMNELIAVGQDPCKFGFAADKETFMKKTCIFLTNKCNLSKGLAWHWHCIQDYIRNSTLLSCNKTVQDYFFWFCSVPIKAKESFISTHDEELLSALWEQSCKGILDYALFS